MGGGGWQLLFGELWSSFFWFYLVGPRDDFWAEEKACPQDIGPLELPAAGFCSAWLTSLVGYNGELLPQVTHGPILSSFFPGPKAGLLPCVGQSERRTVQCWPACLHPGPGLLREPRGALCWSGGFRAEAGNLEMKTGR